MLRTLLPHIRFKVLAALSPAEMVRAGGAGAAIRPLGFVDPLSTASIHGNAIPFPHILYFALSLPGTRPPTNLEIPATSRTRLGSGGGLYSGAVV